MKIAIDRQLGTCEKRKAVIKAWRSNPGNFDTAVHAAHHYAKKAGAPMVVIQGNSYYQKVYRIADTAKDLDYYTGPTGNTYTNVSLVYPSGEVYQAYASDKPEVVTPAGKTETMKK